MALVLVLIGTPNTEGDKVAYLLKQMIENQGETLVIDCGFMAQPILRADVPREQVAEAAQVGIADLRSCRSEEAKVMITKGEAKCWNTSFH